MSQQQPRLYRLILPIVYLFVCIGAIATALTTDAVLGQLPTWVRGNPFLSFLGLLLITQTVTLFDIFVQRKRIEVISSVYFGLLIGFLLAYLFNLALGPVLANSNLQGQAIVRMLSTLMITYVCVSLLIQTRDDFRFVIPYVEFAKEVKGGSAVVLDSSSLIDGRVAELVGTSILDCDFIVPQFVLREVQEIADSGDKLRRTRGRRGLDVLSKLQNNPALEVRVVDPPAKDQKGLSTDQKLIDLAEAENARLMTNDYNLNKVATVQGVPVINLNDVANSLKPRFIPGDRFEIEIVKEGESHGQGVGYLDDGTMVVCEGGARHIGETIGTIVTSVLQSSAGRMIFTRAEGEAEVKKR